MHSIGESKTDFVKPSKPAQETVSLTNPDTIQLITLISMDKIAIKRIMYLFCDKYYILCG